ncbi:limonene-1,2-epoxide hydrolase family protein [Brevundimonas sp.]|uniref:limonene-1,2-epoxide hydrolase family protein n=1 Tax=Brevundimonas sp. TaxID=1871086 RepID=UPI00261E0983|nr:limonene-1,2-epoxide hydrolase family protein [Brevundimonas sp.]
MKRLPIDIIRQFLNAWSDGPEPLEKAIRDLFRADTEWVNMGLSKTVGADEALALGAKFEAAMGYSKILVETLHIAAHGNVVLTERMDRLVAADGREVGAFAIAGIFELDEEGKLLRWRDYTDPSAVAAIHGH